MRIDVVIRDDGNLLTAVYLLDFLRKTVAQAILNQDRIAAFAESNM